MYMYRYSRDFMLFQVTSRMVLINIIALVNTSYIFLHEFQVLLRIVNEEICLQRGGGLL